MRFLTRPLAVAALLFTAALVIAGPGMAADDDKAERFVSVSATGSVVLGRFLETMLFGVGGLDVATYVIVCAAFLGVMIAASYLPARQAAKIDPQSILKYE